MASVVVVVPQQQVVEAGEAVEAMPAAAIDQWALPGEQRVACVQQRAAAWAPASAWAVSQVAAWAIAHSPVIPQHKVAATVQAVEPALIEQLEALVPLVTISESVDGEFQIFLPLLFDFPCIDCRAYMLLILAV